MKKTLFLLMIILLLFARASFADDSDLFTVQVSPNLLVILDNSNSMDEDFWGSAVGSYAPRSKSVIGKKALRNILQQFNERLRIGLMTYRLPGVSANFLHNSPYFVSYDRKSYCPNPPPECVTYARTGDLGAKSTCLSRCQADNPSFSAGYLDEIISYYPVGSEQRNRYADLVYPKTQKMMNPRDPSNYFYYKRAYPMYSDSNLGTAFCYSGGYNPNEGDTPWDGYSCYTGKTGTSDDADGYSGLWFNSQFVPTDTDYALGYQDFGRRVGWNYVGRTWFSNTSPGDGYLQVPVDDLTKIDGTMSHTYNQLWDKLDPKENDEAGYMNCGGGDKNNCSYIINAGLTPTAGTLQTAKNYLKSHESPIQASCQRNFILYVTDGLPSVDETGAPRSADSLMPAVLAKLDALRNTTYNVKGTPSNFDIQTYVLGIGLSDEAKSKLDTMAVHGGTAVNGHAYYADNPQQMMDALGNIFGDVIERSYSFISPTVPSVRVVDRDTLYVSSFTPNRTPYWPGNLKAYRLNSDGTLPVDGNGTPTEAPVWVGTIPGSRVIKTVTSALGFTDFKSSNLTPADLGVSTDQERDQLVSYVKALKLGDILHSNSVIVGSPSPFFKDDGYSTMGGFYENHKNRARVVIVGANDGMLHAFNSSTGIEEWAFIPKGVLKNLQSMLTAHTYYVDSSPRVADVWFYSDDSDNTKSADEWRTVLVCGLRKGGNTYFALDITDPLSPQYLWQFPKSSDLSTLAKVGQSWSEPAIGRVKIEKNGRLVERWAAFIGGGYDSRDKTGMAFFVVDMKTGDVIKKFSNLSGMTHSMPAPPAAVDSNFDGYVDKIYIGDLGGQVWAFDLSFDTSTQKSDSQWSGKRLFEAPGHHAEKHMIYYQAAVGFDKSRKPWVFFGTGDRENPKEYANPPERFYAVRDDGLGTYPRREDDLIDVTDSNTFAQAHDPKKGWFIKLEKTHKSLEKVLSKPSLFNYLVYFTTYTSTPTDDLCSNTSTAKLYAVEYLSGGGALLVDDLSEFSGTAYERWMQVGNGAPSTPVITVNTNGRATVIIGTTTSQIFSKGAFSPPTNKSTLYWREVIP